MVKHEVKTKALSFTLTSSQYPHFLQKNIIHNRKQDKVYMAAL